MQKFCWNI